MTVRRAEAEAHQIRRRLDLGIPVDPYEVARACGVDIVERGMEDSVSGMLVVDGDHGIIGVNLGHHPHRRRFTVAHELAHYLLHRDTATTFVDGSGVFYRDAASSEGTRPYEIEANAFAGELLMPADILRERVGGAPVDAHDDLLLRRLSDEFDVSPHALTVRLTRLDLISG